jgi:hypothetical protein
MAEVVFSVQEVFLSSLYIWLYWRFMDQGSGSGSGNDGRGDGKAGDVGGGRLERRRRQTFWLLIAAQIIILSCDIILTTLLYLELFLARLSVMGFIYAIKLNIEFLVLNRLVGGGKSEDFTQSLRDEGIVVGTASSTISGVGTVTEKGTCDIKSKSSVCQRTDSAAPMLGPMARWPNDRMDEIVTPIEDGEGDLGMLSAATLYHIGSENEVDLERGSLDETEKRYLGRCKV